MSDLELNKTTSTENDTANANSNFNEQKNSNTPTDMDLVKQKETVKPGTLRIADNSLVCLDIENSLETPADENKDEENDRLVNVTALKLSVISQSAERPKYTVLGLYDYVFGPSQRQPHGHSRFTSQVWRQQQPPPQQQQTVWTQYGPAPGYNQSQAANRGQYPNQGQPYVYGDGYNGAYGYEGGGPILYDPGARNSFVRLVMGLVLLMLIATAGFLAAVLTAPELKEFFQRAGWIVILPSMVGLIVVHCGMLCSPCARRPPCNFVCLLIATAAMSMLAAKITCHYRTEIVIYAVIATAAVVLVCVLLAFSNFDFTSYMLYLIAISTGFSVIAMIVLITMFATGNIMKPVMIVVLCIGTLIQIVVLTMELQMVLGGKAIEMSESDYALAAFLIYTSILDIFMKLVHILGLSSN